MSIRVLLVDDNSLFRLGLRALISNSDEFEVVGDMRGGRDAVQATMNLNPDVVVMDIMLAGVSGLESMAQIKRRLQKVKAVILTEFRTEDYIREALRVGADGYVLKDATIEELMTALRSVAQGKKYITPEVSGHLVQGFLNPEGKGGKTSRLEMLTARERSILQLVAEGRTNRGAAEFLSVSPKTVEKHRANLMHKLGLRNAVELTLVALELGLITQPFAISRMSNRSAGNAETA